MKNIFGYLFAKSIESEYALNISTDPYLVSYDSEKACDGNLNIDCPKDIKDKLEFAYDIGKNFFVDFTHYFSPGDKEYDEHLEEALDFVQGIGKYCGCNYLNV